MLSWHGGVCGGCSEPSQKKLTTATQGAQLAAWAAVGLSTLATALIVAWSQLSAQASLEQLTVRTLTAGMAAAAAAALLISVIWQASTTRTRGAHTSHRHLRTGVPNRNALNTRDSGYALPKAPGPRDGWEGRRKPSGLRAQAVGERLR